MKTYFIEIDGVESQHNLPELDDLHTRILEFFNDSDIQIFDQEIQRRFGVNAIVRGTIS